MIEFTKCLFSLENVQTGRLAFSQ